MLDCSCFRIVIVGTDPYNPHNKHSYCGIHTLASYGRRCLKCYDRRDYNERPICSFSTYFYFLLLFFQVNHTHYYYHVLVLMASCVKMFIVGIGNCLCQRKITPFMTVGRNVRVLVHINCLNRWHWIFHIDCFQYDFFYKLFAQSTPSFPAYRIIWETKQNTNARPRWGLRNGYI